MSLYGLSLESLIGGVVLEHIIDDTGQFLRDDSPGDGFITSPAHFLIERADLPIETHRVDRGIGEGDLQVFVSAFVARLMPAQVAGVVRT